MPISSDDPAIRPWKAREPVDHRRLNAIQERAVMEVHAGPGLTSFRKGNSVTLSVVEQPRARPRTALVKVTGNASGGGKYTGTYWDPPAVGAAASGNLTEAELGTASPDPAIRILNVREVGLATHDLSNAGFLPLVFVGEYRGVAADGVHVYVIDGRQSEDCTAP